MEIKWQFNLCKEQVIIFIEYLLLQYILTRKDLLATETCLINTCIVVNIHDKIYKTTFYILSHIIKTIIILFSYDCEQYKNETVNIYGGVPLGPILQLTP